MLTSATPEFIATLTATLGAEIVRPDAAPYLREPRGRYQGQGVVLAPRSTQEVAQIVQACAAARVGIIPYSGGTGLVGGQVMEAGPVPVILSLERMTRLRASYPRENVLVVDAGMILSDVQAAAADIDAALLATAESPSCSELQRHANQRANAVLQRHVERERGYDRDTGHGRSQGAWLAE